MRNIAKWCVLLLLLTSCDVLKQSAKEKRDVTATETEKVVTVNKGGTIDAEIIPEKDRPVDAQGKPKDTIVVVKKDEITKTIYYKADGTVKTETECPETYITEERLKQVIDNSKLKENSKETSFQPITILYIFIGLGILLVLYKKL